MLWAYSRGMVTTDTEQSYWGASEPFRQMCRVWFVTRYDHRCQQAGIVALGTKKGVKRYSYYADHTQNWVPFYMWLVRTSHGGTRQQPLKKLAVFTHHHYSQRGIQDTWTFPTQQIRPYPKHWVQMSSLYLQQFLFCSTQETEQTAVNSRKQLWEECSMVLAAAINYPKTVSVTSCLNAEIAALYDAAWSTGKMWQPAWGFC